MIAKLAVHESRQLERTVYCNKTVSWKTSDETPQMTANKTLEQHPRMRYVQLPHDGVILLPSALAVAADPRQCMCLIVCMFIVHSSYTVLASFMGDDSSSLRPSVTDQFKARPVHFRFFFPSRASGTPSQSIEVTRLLTTAGDFVALLARDRVTRDADRRRRLFSTPSQSVGRRGCRPPRETF